jgi:hypothetical protein
MPNLCTRRLGYTLPLSRPMFTAVSYLRVRYSCLCVLWFVSSKRKYVRHQSVLLVLVGATLPRVLGANVNLSNVDFKGRDLSNHDLSGAILRGANLSGANLSGANLTGNLILLIFYTRAWHSECCHLLLATNSTLITLTQSHPRL